MDIKVDARPKGNGVTLIVLRGEIGAETINEFKTKMDEVITSSVKNYVMDFQEVNYLNSVDIGVVAAALKKAKKNHGTIKVANLSPAVAELFELTRLTKVMEVFENEEEALRSFEE